jgi:uncharacterized ferritin-like protein (DUF455 family)
MTLDAILSTIDAEISKLQQARAMLTDATPIEVKRGPGRPKKVAIATPVKAKKRRMLSDEARAKIAAAQKRRWAAAKKSK